VRVKGTQGEPNLTLLKTNAKDRGVCKMRKDSRTLLVKRDGSKVGKNREET